MLGRADHQVFLPVHVVFLPAQCSTPTNYFSFRKVGEGRVVM